MIDRRRKDKILRSVYLTIILVCFILRPTLSDSIELHPSQQKIDQVVQEGKASAMENLKIMNLFGTMGSCGWGFLQTRLWNIWAGAKIAEKKLKP